MKRNFINAVSATSALGLLLALPGLVNAEDYYRKYKRLSRRTGIRSPQVRKEFEQNPIRAVSRH